MVAITLTFTFLPGRRRTAGPLLAFALGVRGTRETLIDVLRMVVTVRELLAFLVVDLLAPVWRGRRLPPLAFFFAPMFGTLIGWAVIVLR